MSGIGTKSRALSFLSKTRLKTVLRGLLALAIVAAIIEPSAVNFILGANLIACLLTYYARFSQLRPVRRQARLCLLQPSSARVSELVSILYPIHGERENKELSVLRSLERLDYPNKEIVVINCSENPRLEKALENWARSVSSNSFAAIKIKRARGLKRSAAQALNACLKSASRNAKWIFTAQNAGPFAPHALGSALERMRRQELKYAQLSQSCLDFESNRLAKESRLRFEPNQPSGNPLILQEAPCIIEKQALEEAGGWSRQDCGFMEATSLELVKRGHHGANLSAFSLESPPAPPFKTLRQNKRRLAMGECKALFDLTFADLKRLGVKRSLQIAAQLSLRQEFLLAPLLFFIATGAQALAAAPLFQAPVGAYSLAANTIIVTLYLKLAFLRQKTEGLYSHGEVLKLYLIQLGLESSSTSWLKTLAGVKTPKPTDAEGEHAGMIGRAAEILAVGACAASSAGLSYILFKESAHPAVAAFATASLANVCGVAFALRESNRTQRTAKRAEISSQGKPNIVGKSVPYVLN